MEKDVRCRSWVCGKGADPEAGGADSGSAFPRPASQAFWTAIRESSGILAQMRIYSRDIGHVQGHVAQAEEIQRKLTEAVFRLQEAARGENSGR